MTSSTRLIAARRHRATLSDDNFVKRLLRLDRHRTAQASRFVLFKTLPTRLAV